MQNDVEEEREETLAAAAAVGLCGQGFCCFGIVGLFHSSSETGI